MTRDPDADDGLPVVPPEDPGLVLSEPGADYSGSRLVNQCFVGIAINPAIFDRAELRDCVFEGVTFVAASFKNAKVHGCQFLRCDLRGADFSEAEIDSATSFGASDLHAAVGLERVADWAVAHHATSQDSLTRAERLWALSLPMGVSNFLVAVAVGVGQFWCDAPVSVTGFSVLEIDMPGTARALILVLAILGATMFAYYQEQLRVHFVRAEVLPTRLPSGVAFSPSGWLGARALASRRPLSILQGLLLVGVLPWSILYLHWRYREAASGVLDWCVLSGAGVVVAGCMFLVSNRWMLRRVDRAQGPLKRTDGRVHDGRRARRTMWIFVTVVVGLADLLFRALGMISCDLHPAGMPVYPRGIRAEGWDFAGCDLRGVNFEGARLDGASFDHASLDGSTFRFSEADCSSFYGACGEFSVPLGCCVRGIDGSCGRHGPCGADACIERCGCSPPAPTPGSVGSVCSAE